MLYVKLRQAVCVILSGFKPQRRIEVFYRKLSFQQLQELGGHSQGGVAQLHNMRFRLPAQ